MKNKHDTLGLYKNMRKELLIQYKLVLLLAVIEGILPIVSVYLSKNIIQCLLDAQKFYYIWLLAISISLCCLGGKICALYRSIMIKDRMTRTKVNYLKRLIRSYCKADLSFAETEENISAKEVAINAVDFNDSIKNYLEALCKLISGVVSLLGSIYIILELNIFLAVIVVVTFIPEFAINSMKKKIDFKNMHKWGELNRKTNCYASLFTDLKTIKELRVFQADGLVQNSIDKNDKERTREMIKQEKKHSLLDAFFYVFKSLGDGATYCYLVIKLLTKQIQIPQFSLFIGGIGTMSSSINNLSEAYISLKQFGAFLKEYTGFLGSAGAEEHDERIDLTEFGNSIEKIEFIDVSFSYPGQKINALEDVSVVIYPHQSISIVGRNGAGKSTFIKLLLGLYQPTKGKILINGKDISLYSAECLKRIYSVLFQDYIIYPVTIFENVALKEKVGESDLSSVYELVGMNDYICKLPNYDDTLLTKEFEENGIDLSGGQKLRLAIARALYDDSPFLVLDEPSAALDPKAEFEFYQMIYAMRKRKSIVFVSHRMTSSEFCDRILVFDNGHIVGDGNHSELYVSNERYASLVDAQKCS